MASPTLITKTNPFTLLTPNPIINSIATALPTSSQPLRLRRDALFLIASSAGTFILPAAPAIATSDEEYVKDTEEVISKVKSTVNMDRNDPNVETAVADLRESSNFWVAKYRREKSLLARSSFRDMYSVLNAISGHYVSFGPVAPIPVKRKTIILEELETAEKALQRGR